MFFRKWVTRPAKSISSKHCAKQGFPLLITSTSVPSGPSILGQSSHPPLSLSWWRLPLPFADDEAYALWLAWRAVD